MHQWKFLLSLEMKLYVDFRCMRWIRVCHLDDKLWSSTSTLHYHEELAAMQGYGSPHLPSFGWWTLNSLHRMEDG